LLAAAQAALQAVDLQRALALAERGGALQAPDLDDATRVEFARLRCAALYRLAQWATFLDAAAQLLPLLTAPAQQMGKLELLRWMTLAAAELARFDVALQRAHEAWALAETIDSPSGVGLSLAAVAMVVERLGDPWQAVRLLQNALAAMGDKADDAYALLVAHNALCATYIGLFYLLRDSAPSAETRALLREALRHGRACQGVLPRVGSGGYFGIFVQANLGEILVHLGRLKAAEAALKGALELAGAATSPILGWRARCSWAEVLLARGQAAEAVDHLERLLGEMQGSSAEYHSTRLRVHHALYRGAQRLGRLDQALAQLEAFERLQSQRIVAQLKAQSQLFVTRAEAEQSHREAQAERERAARLQREAEHDTLTGLGNRRYLDRCLPSLLASAREAGGSLAMAVLDLDHFKQVNDRFGHAVGDQVLVQIARLLEAHTRGRDVVVRLGGEEFLVLFDHASREVAREACERLRAHVARHDWGGLAPGLGVSISIGLAATPPYDGQQLYERADRALYRAKAEGRNRVAVEAG
jgi:diguanylate cyclase (GGDEF)-like protein